MIAGRYKPYPAYKPSGVEWLGDIPSKWKITRVKFVSQCLDGARIPLNASERGERAGPYPYWGANKIVDFIDSYIFDEELVLLGEDGAPFFDAHKDVAFNVSGKIWPNNHVHILRPNKGTIDAAFLTYCLNVTEFHHYITGSTRDKLNQSDMNEIALRFPPVPEQTQIGAFLDHEAAKIDELIAKQERLIELLEEKRQVVISHAVTKGLNPDAPLRPSGIDWLGDVPVHWGVGKSRYYLTVVSGFAFSSSGFTSDVADTKLLRGINVGVNRLKWAETVFWRRKNNDGLDIYEMQEGDLVLGMDRPLIGKGVRVAKVTKKDLPCLLLQRVTSLKTSKKLDCDYLFSLLSSELFVAHITPDMTGVSVPHLSPGQIGDFVIPVPPFSEQRKIAEYLFRQGKTFDDLINKAQSAITLLKERRTALISAAVTGKIDVRDWQPPKDISDQDIEQKAFA